MSGRPRERIQAAPCFNMRPTRYGHVRTGCFYVRYMDDWVVLAPTRWKLRAAIRAVNQVMVALRVRQHPDKTSSGRIQRGFDFLGYHFSATGMAVARQTYERCAARMTRLYEQGAAISRIGVYVRRWERWVKAGLGGMGYVAVEGEIVLADGACFAEFDGRCPRPSYHFGKRGLSPF